MQALDAKAKHAQHRRPAPVSKLKLVQQCRLLTPVQAVPANTHARGSKYQGDMAIRYKLAATDANVIATALHDFHGFMSKTCRHFMMLQGHSFLSM